MKFCRFFIFWKPLYKYCDLESRLLIFRVQQGLAASGEYNPPCFVLLRAKVQTFMPILCCPLLPLLTPVRQSWLGAWFGHHATIRHCNATRKQFERIDIGSPGTSTLVGLLLLTLPIFSCCARDRRRSSSGSISCLKEIWKCSQRKLNLQGTARQENNELNQ